MVYHKPPDGLIQKYRGVMGVNNAKVIVHLVLILTGFYIIFAFNNVIDSYFYGIGRTDLMLYQSLAVNILFYGSAFIGYLNGLFIPSLNKIALMFGLGLIVDAVITYVLYRWLRVSKVKSFVLNPVG